LAASTSRIYVLNRRGNTVEVIDPVTNKIVQTIGGIVGPNGVAFSPDKAQRFLFISDLTNNHIWFLTRDEGTVAGQMGTMSQNGGQFMGLHMIAVDSKGNIYTGEVSNGERVQRFVAAK
jgi:YVTN family beta-propeller protein